MAKTVNADPESMLRASAELLSELVESLGGGLHEDGTHSAIVADICRATTAASTIAAELRQREKQAAKERNALTIETVLEWFRSRVLTTEQRLHLVREMTATLDETASILG